MTISTEEFLEVLREAGDGMRTVEIGRHGIWLKTATNTCELSPDQADIVFSTLMSHLPKRTIDG